MPLCHVCQDYVDHKTEYCPSHTCKKCGQSGHVAKVCPQKEVAINLNQNQVKHLLNSLKVLTELVF